MDIRLGAGEPGVTRQAFARGQLVVRSRRGVHPSEEALLNALPTGKAGNALVVNSAEGLAALALRALNPRLSVHCHFDDAWDLDAARQTARRHPDLAPDLALAPDPPEGPWDIVAMPSTMAGLADLLRERLAFALRCLRPGGLLFTSTDNRRDRFLRDQVLRLFGSATTLPGPTRRSGVAYIARRPPNASHPDLDLRRTFSVKDGDRVLSFLSRPGVFCHGRLDAGTRALLTSDEFSAVLGSLAPPSSGRAPRILDLGCGAGVLGLVAALRCPDAHVTLVDSHARAIECAEANAASLGVRERCTTLLSANAARDLSPGYAVVLSNPPYYGNWRIAEMFLDAAAKLLVSGGRVLLVTKAPEWFAVAMRGRFVNVAARPARGYAIVSATQRA